MLPLQCLAIGGPIQDELLRSSQLHLILAFQTKVHAHVHLVRSNQFKEALSQALSSIEDLHSKKAYDQDQE